MGGTKVTERLREAVEARRAQAVLSAGVAQLTAAFDLSCSGVGDPYGGSDASAAGAERPSMRRRRHRRIEWVFAGGALAVAIAAVVGFVVYTSRTDGTARVSALFAGGLVLLSVWLLLWSYARRPPPGEDGDFLDRFLADAGQALLLGAVLSFGFGIVGEQLDREQSTVDLRRDLAGQVRADAGGKSFRGVDLRSQSFVGLNLSGFDLSGTDLSQADMSFADLSGANLDNANLSQARLSGADLTNADLTKAILIGANLMNADLSGANLSGFVEFDMTDPDMAEAAQNLPEPDLSLLSDGADLSDANLRSAILTDAHLAKANLSYARLSRADLTDADLSGVNLFDADLRSASLRGATLKDADLTEVDLRGTNLSEADLSGADLSDAWYDADTVWPDSIEQPPPVSPSGALQYPSSG